MAIHASLIHQLQEEHQRQKEEQRRKMEEAKVGMFGLFCVLTAQLTAWAQSYLEFLHLVEGGTSEPGL